MIPRRRVRSAASPPCRGGARREALLKGQKIGRRLSAQRIAGGASPAPRAGGTTASRLRSASAYWHARCSRPVGADGLLIMTAAAPEPKAEHGPACTRYDAVVKVTGRATYALRYAAAEPAYAFMVTSAIAKGRVDGFDLDDAKRVRGVIDIVTHENAPKLKDSKLFSNGGYAGTTIQPLKSADIAHDGRQIIAVVIAESYEAAREARQPRQGEIHAAAPTRDASTRRAKPRAAAEGPERAVQGRPEVGDFAKAFEHGRSHGDRVLRRRRAASQSDGAVLHELRLDGRDNLGDLRAESISSTASRMASPSSSASTPTRFAWSTPMSAAASACAAR